MIYKVFRACEKAAWDKVCERFKKDNTISTSKAYKEELNIAMGMLEAASREYCFGCDSLDTSIELKLE